VGKQTFNYSSISFNRDQQKKRITSIVNPNFLSQKHLFEWEDKDSSSSSFSSSRSVVGFKPRKLIIGNRVYGDENNKHYLSTSREVKSNNILLGECETAESKGVKRRNPNFTYKNEEKPERRIRERCTSAQHESYDNPLKYRL
jgi:hypothetical protein